MEIEGECRVRYRGGSAGLEEEEGWRAGVEIDEMKCWGGDRVVDVRGWIKKGGEVQGWR